MTAYMRSPCCDAPVVGMVDITVHPRVRVDGTFGPIIDTLSDVRQSVRLGALPDPHDAYCGACGASVEIPHKCHEPWRHGER